MYFLLTFKSSVTTTQRSIHYAQTTVKERSVSNNKEGKVKDLLKSLLLKPRAIRLISP